MACTHKACNDDVRFIMTANPLEIEKFQKDSARWWDEDGPFKPLHKLNPVRIDYIKRQICNHFGRDYEAFDSFDGLSILDIGCGGGLICEPMARLGGTVTGLDADAQAIQVAKTHAQDEDLNIAYQCETTTAHLKNGAQYDVVLALEIIEHVDDPAAFVGEVVKLCKSGGLIIFSTLNKTAQSYALGIIGAEYILRWVPRGTHDWQKFIKPSALATMVQAAGAKPHDTCGLVFSPLKNEFVLSKRNLAVNYFMSAKV